jgi:hypothetical protein
MFLGPHDGVFDCNCITADNNTMCFQQVVGGSTEEDADTRVEMCMV